MTHARLLLLPLLFAASCGGGGTTDGGMDAGHLGPRDAGGVDSGLTTLPGLHQPVNVVRDTRGMIHIYASDLHDAAYANGYLQAQDRFSQMEFTRRLVTGRLSEVLGGLDASTIDRDID